jgi:hypothetical protein
LLNKWGSNSHVQKQNPITSFDFNVDVNELCYVKEDGSVNFLRLHQSTLNTEQQQCTQFVHKDASSLNSVLYLKQSEIAVADTLGRIKLWDTRNKDNRKASMTLSL